MHMPNFTKNCGNPQHTHLSNCKRPYLGPKMAKCDLALSCI
uniref:Uncharacterized protein n=1 Tax=Anguilla anguilla TaxID=7936 RepID=A0A0E9SJQ7_ANGAN